MTVRALSVFCRVTSRVNTKPRPPWFRKADCLDSLFAAVDRLSDSGVSARVVLVVDGRHELDWSLDALVAARRTRVEIVDRPGGTSRRSMLNLYDAALARAGSGAGAGEIAWFAEDDYVYDADAFVHLVAAADRHPDADYFALHYPDDTAWHRTHTSQPLAKRPFPLAVHRGGAGPSWLTVTHSTSTFGGRMSAVRRDRWLLRLATRAGSPFAHATCMAVQGRQPYRWRALGRDVNWSRPARWPLGLLRAPMRAAVNLGSSVQAYSGRAARSPMLAPRTDLVCHAELGFVTAHRDWAAAVPAARRGGDPFPDDRTVSEGSDEPTAITLRPGTGPER